MRQRRLLGWALILHGIAHASAGTWAVSRGGGTTAILLWEIAAVGFMTAGIGVLGVPRLFHHWRWLTVTAAAASVALMLLFGHALYVSGIAIDFLFIAIALWTLPTRLASPAAMPRTREILLCGAMIYVASVIGAREWYSTWGTTRAEREMALIGDPAGQPSFYRIDRAVTIDAPVDSVWPWLVQIGQDRAGFYSYDRLERAFGADIQNVDRIVPEWQLRKPGDLVRATQRGYLGGILGQDPGWRVSAVEPGRAIVLDGWGSFVLRPAGESTTRLHIRTRGNGTPTLSGIFLTPAGLLIFEPAHFIMERGMMLGIKRRAEGRTI